VTAGPLHGPLTFAEWLRTLTVEVELTGLLADVTIEARADDELVSVELLPGSPFTRVEQADADAPARAA